MFYSPQNPTTPNQNCKQVSYYGNENYNSYGQYQQYQSPAGAITQYPCISTPYATQQYFNNNNETSFSSGYSSGNASLYNQYYNSPLATINNSNYTESYQFKNNKDLTYPANYSVNQAVSPSVNNVNKTRKPRAKKVKIDEIKSVNSITSFNLNDILNPIAANNNNNVMNASLKQEYEIDNSQVFSDNDEFDDSQLEPADKKKRVLNSTQRIAANKRERKRMSIMNDAFVDLRHKLPISTGRKRRKMSRLDIVIGACEYISYLDSLLNNNGNSNDYIDNSFQIFNYFKII